MPSGHFESARWHHFRTEHVSTLVCQHAPASGFRLSARRLPPVGGLSAFQLVIFVIWITYDNTPVYNVRANARTCASLAPTISIRHSRNHYRHSRFLGNPRRQALRASNHKQSTGLRISRGCLTVKMYGRSVDFGAM